MQIIQFILVVVTILGLCFSNWIGPILGNILTPIVNTPMGAVFMFISLLTFAISFINLVKSSVSGRKY